MANVKKAARFFMADGGSVKTRVVRSGLWVGLSSGLGSLINLGRSVVLARLLTPEVFGLMGLASIIADWGRPYTLVIRIHPEWQGQLERPLLAKLIRRLQHMSRRNIVIHYPDGDPTMDHLLQAANFSQRRALTHMRRSIY